MCFIACLGALETGYLTFNKLTGGSSTTGSLAQFCGTSGSCGSVLDGPYAVIPNTNIPLAALGFMAYAAVAYLALAPTIKSYPVTESDNRIWLATLTTAMGVFSVFLMALLFGVLKESCVFCVASAFFSVTLMTMSWLNGARPTNHGATDHGVSSSAIAGGWVAALVLSTVLFISVDDESSFKFLFAGTAAGGASSTTNALRAETTTSSRSRSSNAPPVVSTSSSAQALDLSTRLQALDAKMYGAYWCSHCHDQKEKFGREAMQRIPYVECASDGDRSQSNMCRQRDVPGYPTWEINGKLYPGERDLDELEEIISGAG